MASPRKSPKALNSRSLAAPKAFSAEEILQSACGGIEPVHTCRSRKNPKEEQ